MDMVMPGMDGATATRTICQKHPQVQVIALTSFKEGDLVKNALEAGAIGYLLKDVSADELVRAIRAAHAGRATLSPEAAQSLVETSNQPPIPGLDLTEREREVLALLVEGLNNTQIAGRLTVSPSTIKSHIASIYVKLGVSTRDDAVAALGHGWAGDELDLMQFLDIELPLRGQTVSFGRGDVPRSPDRLIRPT